MNATNRPANELRIGNIKAAVWRNENEGSIRYNVTFTRIYRDAEHWKATDAFGRDDLLVVAKLADQAHTWICTQARENRSESLTAGARTEAQGAGSTTRDRPAQSPASWVGRPG